MWYPTSRTVATPAERSRTANAVRLRQHGVSRRRMLRTVTGVAALAAGAGLWLPVTRALAQGDVIPMPIPGGNDFLNDGHFVHVFVPEYGQEPSTITDFDGFVAAAEIRGSGMGIDTATGAMTPYYYDADMRFMDGMYVGMDGGIHQGAFGFV